MSQRNNPREVRPRAGREAWWRRRPHGRMQAGLVALSSVAIASVYAAGYAETEVGPPPSAQALQLDLEGCVRGIGSVTVRTGDTETVVRRGECFPLTLLLAGKSGPVRQRRLAETDAVAPVSTPAETGFWNGLHALEADFQRGLNGEAEDATNAILGMDRLIWEAQQAMENPEFISQGREILPECIVLLGTRLASVPRSREECLASLVEALLALRASFRKNRQWREADAIRDCLARAAIEIEDTREGYRWRLGS